MSANSAAAGVTNVASAAATAPRAISGPGLTPACGFLNVPRTYSGDRSVIIRIPLLSGSMVKSSYSEAKLAVPVTLINAFSVSKAKICGRATPFAILRFAAAQLTRTSSSPKICPTI